MKAQVLLYFFFAVTLDPCGSQDLFFPFFSYFKSNNEQLIIGRYDEDVILPCLFRSGSEVVIHWKIQDNYVHSYYSDMDQLEGQYFRYANRTSLFHSEIHNGNASLTIRKLSLLDEGIYTCYVATTYEYTTNKVVLKVGAFHAPLMKYEKKNTESFLVCSILSTYPRPRITWKMDNANISEGRTEVTGFPGPFYVKSTLNITGSNSSFECAIENSLLKQTWRGEWTSAGSLWINQSESISLWCTVSSNFSLQNQDFHVTWSRIEENGAHSVLDWHLNSSQDRTANDPRFSRNKELRGHGALPKTLKHLHASDSGEYLCNISSTEYTLLTVHRLHVAPGQERDHRVLLMVLLLPMVLAIWYYKVRRDSSDSEGNVNPGRSSRTEQAQEAGLCDCMLSPCPQVSTAALCARKHFHTPSCPQESPGFPESSEMCPVSPDESDNSSGYNGHKASFSSSKTVLNGKSPSEKSASK